MKITIEQAVKHLKEMLESSEDCYFDHNGDCQEHSWFGIKGKCPVAQAKSFIDEYEAGHVKA